jgi:type IV pilus assembly protein PilV
MKNIQSQDGVILLEALIGILIFTIGILAMVAMQANAISNVSNAQYRSEASALAEEIIAQMQIDRGNDPLTLLNVNNYAMSSGSSAYGPADAWLTKVKNKLPGATTNPPIITVVTSSLTGTPGAAKDVTVTIRWRAPTATSVSNHVAVATISGS